jgi:hypothetical protein
MGKAMLKHFYKSFLVTILSTSLLMFQTSIVFADTTTSTTDSTGKVTTTTKYDLSKISDMDMLTSIAMLAGGFVAGRMAAVYKPITTDVMIASAAGAAFIAGEVLTNVSFNGQINKMTAEVVNESDDTVNEEQIQRLKDLRSSYEKAKSTTKMKKVLQLAAAAAFGAAALTSTYMAMSEEAKVTSCRAAFATAKTKLAACVAAGASTVAGASEATACGECAASLVKDEFEFNKYYISRIPPGPSMAKDAQTATDEVLVANPAGYCAASTGLKAQAAAKVLKADCLAAVHFEIKNQTQGRLTKMAQNKLESDFDKFLNFFIPKAEAAWLPLLGLGAAATAAFSLMAASSAMETDTLMFVPRNRAIAFGLFSALSYAASKSSDNVISKLEGNITKIDSILANLNKLATGVKAVNVSTQTLTINSTVPATSEITLSTDGSSTSCLTSTSSSNCTSASVSTTSGFSDLPESLQSLATEAVSVGNGVSGKSSISGATLAAAESLGSKAAAIRKLASTKAAEYSKLTNSKESAQQQQDKLLSSLTNKVKSDLQSKGISASGMMASIGSSPISATDVLKEEKSIATKNTNTSGTTTTSSTATGVKGDFKIDFKEQTTASNGAEAVAKSSMPEYDIKGNDISGENGPSIFDLISNRYLKSGYSKLLEVESK